MKPLARCTRLAELHTIPRAIDQRIQLQCADALLQLSEARYHFGRRVQSRTTVALPVAVALSRQSRQIPDEVLAAINDVVSSASALSCAVGSTCDDLSNQYVVIWLEINFAPQAVESICRAYPLPLPSTRSLGPDVIGKVPLHFGHTVISPTRATYLPWMSTVRSALMTVPP